MKKQFLLLLVLIINTYYLNANAQWLQAGGTIADTVTSLLKIDNILIAGGLGGVFYSSDNGENWTGKNSNSVFGGTTVYSLFNANGKLFAGTDVLGIFSSNDTGNTWTKVDKNLYNIPIYSLYSNDTNLFAATDRGIILLTNNGLGWRETDTLLRDNTVYSLFANKDSLFAGTKNSLFLSTNSGIGWMDLNSGLPDVKVFAITYFNSNLIIGTTGGVFIYSHNSKSWMYMNNGLTNLGVHALAVSGINMFAGTNYGIFSTIDSVNTWVEVDDGFTFPFINALIISGPDLVAGSWGAGAGVWSRPLSEMITNISDKKNNLTKSFSLEQNYPNPFNPTTNINYFVSKTSFVTIKIYDILGRKVATIVNENKIPGNYRVEFNAIKLVSGIYFYTMKAGDFEETKKLILIK